MKRVIAALAGCSASALMHSLPANAQACSTSARCATTFMSNGLYGVKDTSGQQSIPPKFKRAYRATERYPDSGAHGLIITELDGKFGFVNRDGVETEPPRFKRVSAKMHGHFLVETDDKKCVINKFGKRIVDCKYDIVLVSDRSNAFFVKDDAGGRYITASGETLNFSQPQPAPRPAQPEPASPKIVAAPVSELEGLVNARRWDEAVRAAAKAGDARDIRDVLLIFNRTASTSDARYQAGKAAIYENLPMFQKATTVVSSMERSELNRMESMIRTWYEGPVYAPSGGGYINATTVGQCLSMGGTVTVMQRCAR